MDQTRRSDVEHSRNHPRAARIRRQFRLIGAAVAAGAVAACSGVVENSDGIARLDVVLPANIFLEPGVPLRLVAIARNKAGDSIAAKLIWRSPDTTVTIDSLTGIVNARFTSGSAQIQVGVFGTDTLVTALGDLTLTLTAKADSLRLISADSVTITKDGDGTVIRTKLEGGVPPVGVAGRPVVLRIVEPAPVDSPAVSFGFSRTVDSLGSDGLGTVAATLKPERGRTAPDRVVVQVDARRATGELIPGSGRRVVVRFLHQ